MRRKQFVNVLFEMYLSQYIRNPLHVVENVRLILLIAPNVFIRLLCERFAKTKSQIYIIIILTQRKGERKKKNITDTHLNRFDGTSKSQIR